ncbi:50S ribosomal protein L39e [archaeon]|jgi:ribosomal protein L39E|nr:50S ribosomal protein L39e [archaeon]MBT3451075.1 50S ribosomal protein L39e [archaeon]MBT6869469.1 50S ribosomal protein L39e [archaeon]MBT7193157.1 50S ribosomal protein L39e [archaeon]MBT7380463.1 50S ribosomal protein L39e [archaeon]
MARNKHPAKKKRLIKLSTQTKWAPFWTVLKMYGKGKKVHPSRHTEVKRHWRRTNTKA